MTKLRNLLRCYAIGMSIKSISSAFHVSRNTVRKYVRRYQESGLTLDQLMTMSEEYHSSTYSCSRRTIQKKCFLTYFFLQCLNSGCKITVF